MSSGNIPVCAMFSSLKEKISSDMGHKAAVLLQIIHIYNESFKLRPHSVVWVCSLWSHLLNVSLIDHFQLINSLFWNRNAEILLVKLAAETVLTALYTHRQIPLIRGC